MKRSFASLCAGPPANENRADSGCSWTWVDHAEDLAVVGLCLSALGAAIVFLAAAVLFL